MEIWGKCGDCDRWFYCEDWGGHPPIPTCPACGAEAAAYVNRESGEPVLPGVVEPRAGMA